MTGADGMRRRIFLSLAGASVLAGCGGFRQSRVNPRNWFGRGRSRRVAPAAEGTDNPLIPERADSIFRRRREEVYLGTPVDQVTEMVIERTSDGGIVRVTGLPLRQGAYDVRLVPDNTRGEPVNGTIGFQLMAVQPDDQPQGTARQREVRAAVFVSAAKLERTEAIRVRGARNEQVSRR